MERDHRGMEQILKNDWRRIREINKNKIINEQNFKKEREKTLTEENVHVSVKNELICEQFVL